MKYFKLDWPESIVPDGEPTWLYYEVDSLSDNVIRVVYEMASGALYKNSLELENRGNSLCVSLVEGSFTEAINGMPFDFISKKQFELLYSNALFIRGQCS